MNRTRDWHRSIIFSPGGLACARLQGGLPVSKAYSMKMNAFVLAHDIVEKENIQCKARQGPSK